MTDKPSRNEEEYFARQHAEQLKARRAEAAAEAARKERAAHHMKCPKCGANLHAEVYHTIHVDRCEECQGLWFDAGEAELLIKANEAHGVGGIFRSIVRGVRGKTAE
ncbi:MAG TPA: zf-TFIIB domain-containing protein [Gemmatimonadales bacterium]